MSEHTVTVSTVIFIEEAADASEARQKVEEKLTDIAWDWGAISA